MRDNDRQVSFVSYHTTSRRGVDQEGQSCDSGENNTSENHKRYLSNKKVHTEIVKKEKEKVNRGNKLNLIACQVIQNFFPEDEEDSQDLCSELLLRIEVLRRFQEDFDNVRQDFVDD